MLNGLYPALIILHLPLSAVDVSAFVMVESTVSPLSVNDGSDTCDLIRIPPLHAPDIDPRANKRPRRTIVLS